MRDAFIDVLTDLAQDNPRIALITGDLGFSVFENFAEKFPKQFINAGVAEQNMTAIATGMAMSGWKVYTYSIANFATLRCLEQIRNDVCYHDADVTVVSVGAGFSYGQLGMSHFSLEDLAILRSLPNLRVVAPCEKWETRDLTVELAEKCGPAYLRLDKGVGGSERINGEPARLGKARRLREGKDVTIMAIGAIVSEAIAGAERLAARGVEARVLAFNSLKPLDHDAILAAARETGGIVTLEEHSIIGGLGGAVAETCLESGIQTGFFRRLGMRDMFPTVVGDQDYLRAEYGIDKHALEKVTLQAINK